MITPGFDPEFAAAADWARLYRANGVQIVPCKNKIPRLKSWKEYQNALVPDVQFEAWYGHAGEFAQSYDMGMLTGTASGRVLMIDLDIYKAGGYAAAAWWQGLMAVHNNRVELETWKQITGGGGLQMFFLYPPDWKFAVNAQTDLNIDIKCQGGFAVLPPTRHESGKSYAWVDGFSPWEIPIALAPDWLLEAVERLIREHGGGSQASEAGQSRPSAANPGQAGQYDAFGHQTDGRESFMRDLVWGSIVDWYRECPIKPSDGESVAKAREKYQVYEAQVNPQGAYQAGTSKTAALENEGRGPTEFGSKWHHAMKQWDTKVAEEAKKPSAKIGNKSGYTDYTEEFAKAEQQAEATGDIFPFLDINQILDKEDPVWVVDGIINERALGFIFGPPSSLKTFIALDLALSMAARLPQWWNRGISRHGAVVYLCREGTSSFKQRIQAWEIWRKCMVRGIPFYLIEHPCNFMDPGDVGKAVATIRAIATKAGVNVAAVMVDTVSRVLPGAEENLQKDMTLFVRACELIQHEFHCIVVGVHHTNKNGAIRGSTVLPGAGDFLLETRRETGQMAGMMVLQKVKDGEDGVELPFRVNKVDVPGGIVARTSLVVDPDGDARPASAADAAGGGDLPDMVVCREILAAIALAWFQKMPWCKSANGARPAVDMISGRWQLKRDVVKKLLALWLANGVIENEVYDKRNKLSGYRKLVDL
jgi:hypothetical protein